MCKRNPTRARASRWPSMPSEGILSALEVTKRSHEQKPLAPEQFIIFKEMRARVKKSGSSTERVRGVDKIIAARCHGWRVRCQNYGSHHTEARYDTNQLSTLINYFVKIISSSENPFWLMSMCRPGCRVPEESPEGTDSARLNVMPKTTDLPARVAPSQPVPSRQGHFASIGHEVIWKTRHGDNVEELDGLSHLIPP